MATITLWCMFAVLLLGGWTEGQQTGGSVQQCPSGWLSWQTYCYLFVNSTRVTWEQARAECQDQQAHLLRIETGDEYNFLRKSWESTPSSIPNSEMYWTALNNLPMNQGASQNAVYMWGNDEFPLDSVVANHWDKEPDNTAWKDCVSVNTQGALSMVECTDNKPYICQFKLAPNEQCPLDWIMGYSSQYCYKVSNATAWTKFVPWTEARKTCESNPNRKTTLITVTSADVQNFLAERLPGIYNGRSSFWTALNDINQEGAMMWAGNDGIAFNKANFDGQWRTEPNNLGGNEHCGCFMPDGRWNDRNCEDRLNYACRRNLNTGAQGMNFGCGSWTRAGLRCVHVYNTLKNWADARQFCQSAGGDLLSFNTQSDADWVTMQAQNNLAQRRHPGYWIGLNDQQTEGTYVWADGSMPMGGLLNWDQEPNNNLYCSTMNAAGYFSDWPCSWVHSGSICEEATSRCSPGWIPYGGHCYRVDLTWKTRNEASQFCNTTSATYQGRLFALNSAAEKNWIQSQMPNNYTAGIPHRFWTGLVNRNGWVWENSDDQDPQMTQKLVYSSWASEPNNYDDEDCVEMLANGHLNDAHCQQSRGFICQKNAVLPSTIPTQAPVRTTPGGGGNQGGGTQAGGNNGGRTQGGGNQGGGRSTVSPGNVGTTGGSSGKAAVPVAHYSAFFASLLAPLLLRLLA